MSASDAGDNHTGYRPQLDGLRAFAVFAVLIHHFRGMSFAPLGPAGVYLFFVLSGYLITDILLRCRQGAEQEGLPKRLPLRQFYIRRFLRIFPLYYLAVFMTAALDVRGAREYLGWNLLYLGNFRSALEGEWNGKTVHFWSLAVEEQFYLFWPLLMMFLPTRLLKPAVIGAVAIGVVSKVVVYYLVGQNRIPAYVLPICCLDTLGAGALLAILHREGVRPGRLILAAGLVLLAVAAPAYKLAHGGVLWVVCASGGVALAGTWLVSRAADGLPGPAGRLLSSRPMTGVGRISYGIYVWHPFLVPLLALVAEELGVGPVSRWARFAILAPATLALAWFTWELFERPINDFKRHFPYLPRPRPKPAASEQPEEPVDAVPAA